MSEVNDSSVSTRRVWTAPVLEQLTVDLNAIAGKPGIRSNDGNATGTGTKS